jgi:nucleolar protein 15
MAKSSIEKEQDIDEVEKDTEEFLESLALEQEDGNEENPEEEVDSSDEEQEELKIHDLPPPKAPASKKTQEQTGASKAKAADSKTPKDAKSAIVYIGRLPHGFYEDQLRGYFSQFGNVLNLRVSRNKKTGRSKHYAFLEFDSSEVAQIVVDTMDNYVLYGRILKCKIFNIPVSENVEEFRKKLWKGANKKFVPVDHKKKLAEQHNRVRTPDEKKQRLDRLVKKEQKLKRKIKQLGIDYDFKGYSDSDVIAKDVKKKASKAKGKAEVKAEDQVAVVESETITESKGKVESKGVSVNKKEVKTESKIKAKTKVKANQTKKQKTK